MQGMKKFSFKNWLVSIPKTAFRFPLSLVFLIAFSVYCFLEVNNKIIELQPRMWSFLGLGFLVSLATALFLESFKSGILKLGITLFNVALLVVYVQFLPAEFQQVNIFQVISLAVVFLLCVFFVSYFPKNNDISFWEFCKNIALKFIISYIFSLVLMIGLSLAVLSLKELFKVDVQPEVYQNLSIVCFVIFAPIYFMADIPSAKEKYTQDYQFAHFLKVLGLYIIFPILLLYFFILYVYLIQIVVKWELPNGWVSTLVSTLALVGFFCMFILYPLRLQFDKRVDVFSKYFPILLLPLLVLMSVGIFRRVTDYGISINRCYVLILNVWLYGICFYLYLSKAKHLKWVIISFTTLLFLVSVGPWSVYNFTKINILTNLEQQLQIKGVRTVQQPIDFHTINHLSKVDKEQFFDGFEYIYQNYGPAQLQYLFKDSLQKNTIWELREMLGLKKDFKVSRDIQNFNFNHSRVSNNFIMNVHYNQFYRLQKSENDSLMFKNDSISIVYMHNCIHIESKNASPSTFTISIKEALKDYLNTEVSAKDKKEDELVIEGDVFKLVVNQVYGTYSVKSDSISVNSLNANLFLKQ